MDTETIKRRLLIKYPSFGSILANLKFEVLKEISTAATDGSTIYYNPEFISSLSKDEQTFVFAHEICHIAFNHIDRRKDKNNNLWNIATDSVINALLKEDGLPLVNGAVDIDYAINYDAEEMYNILLNQNQQQSHGSSNKEQESQDVGHDTHSMWCKALENQEKENQDVKKLTEQGEQETFKQNKIERKKQLDKLRDILVQEAHGYGHDTNSVKITVTDINTSKPLLDWRVLLRESIKVDVDWSYQNAQIENGVLTPHLEETPKSEVEILLDTSGSVNEELLKNFLRECKNILNVSKVKVGCFDTKFYGFQEIRNAEDINNLEFYGGGGTDFDVAVKAFSKRVENKIIFTDGYARLPEVSDYIIWVVYSNRKIEPKGGRVIYISDEQLNELQASRKSR